MNYNLQKNLDLIPQFDTDTLYCLKIILYYNELCHELYERGECN